MLLTDDALIESMCFWGYLAQPSCIPCEPDVELRLRDPKNGNIWLLIEAKYRSGKSSFASEKDSPPNDQLAREFDNLRVMAQKNNVTKVALVYVTADFVCPKGEIESSASDYRNSHLCDPSIYWLSWRILPQVLESVAARVRDGSGFAKLAARFRSNDVFKIALQPSKNAKLVLPATGMGVEMGCAGIAVEI